MKLGKRLEMMQELKSIKENKQEIETCNCGCENCQCNVEKEEETILSDEEIEEIIKTEYEDRDSYEKISLKHALKLFGNKYSYQKTDFRCIKNSEVNSEGYNKLVTVTCSIHGDFTINRSKFFKIGCPHCFLEELNGPDLVNKILETFKYKDYPNTREYLKKTYISNNSMRGITSLITKEDFITLALSIRNDIYLYDFSDVPDIIIGTSSKFLVKFNDQDLNISGDWVTDIHHFIERKQTPIKLKGKYLGIERSEKISEIVKSKLKEMYPTLDFSESIYSGMHQPINFRCKIHNTELTYASAHSMLRNSSVSGFRGCPDCLREYRESLEATPSTKTTKEFIEDCERVYGVGTFDYSLVKYKRWDIPVEIIDLKYNEVFSVRPSYFLKGKGSPFQYESGGEALVRRSLEKIKKENINNMVIEKEQAIKDKVEGRNTNMVIIDYICYIDSKEVWIEYNGQQHYNSYYYKQFDNWESLYKKQLKRDMNIKEYCKNNSIILIEIPYTYNNNDSVYKLLYEILVNNKNPKDLIIIPEIEEV